MEFFKHARKKIIKDSNIKKYKKDSMIFNNSNECLGMVKVISGKIRAYIMSDEGREINLFEIKSNECCVISASCIINKNIFKTNIIAEEDTDIIIINNKILKDIIKDNIHVRCLVYELMNNKMSMILTLMQNMLFNDLTKRLSDFLIKIYERDNDTEINITQEDIAKNIGYSREGVSRMLKKFEKEDLIVLSRKKIILKNINKLKNI